MGWESLLPLRLQRLSHAAIAAFRNESSFVAGTAAAIESDVNAKRRSVLKSMAEVVVVVTQKRVDRRGSNKH